MIRSGGRVLTERISALGVLTLPFFFKAFFYTRLFSNKIIFPAKKRRMRVCEWVRAALKERDRMKERSQAFYLTGCLLNNKFV